MAALEIASAVERHKLLLPAIAAALYIYFCIRIAGHARKAGRNPVAWFFLTFCFVGIPAIVLFMGHRRADAAVAGAEPGGATPLGQLRCPHCRAMLSTDQIDRTSGSRACPRCHLSLPDEVHLA
jgi:hypothetical protein